MEINIADLKIEPHRIKKTGQNPTCEQSGIKIEHIPTGVTVICPPGISQRKTKDIAMLMLDVALDKYIEELFSGK